MEQVLKNLTLDFLDKESIKYYLKNFLKLKTDFY